MRRFLLLLVAVSAFNAEIWNENPKKYVAGNEYEYAYDAQVLSGIPMTSWHYTGYRLLAKVRVIVKQMTEITLKLENIEFLKINNRINVDEPTVFLPRELFEELNLEETKEIIKLHLQRPILFQWTNGVVRNLRVDQDDVFWSVNMKKGLLNLLNMDLTPNKDEDRTIWNGNFIQSRMEEGVEGVCNSIYRWNRSPILNVNKENVAISMTKTRNIDDCIEKPVFQHALFTCENCEGNVKNIGSEIVKSESTTHMNVTFWTNKKDFFAWTVKSHSRYTFPRMHAKLGSMSTFVKQQLTFVNEKPMQGDDVNQNTLKEETTLQMIVTIPEIMEKKEENQVLTRKLFQLLNEIRSMIREKNSQMVSLIRDFVSILRISPKTVIEKVHKECQQQVTEHPDMFELFHDILPTVATKEAVEVIVEQAILNVQSQVEDDTDVARRVRMLGFMNNVIDEEIVLTLLKVLKNPTLLKKTSQRKETLKSLMFTVGTLTRNFMEYRKLNANSKLVQRKPQTDLEKEVLTVFTEMFNQDIPVFNKEEQQIVLLKAIGNSGIKESFDFITENFLTKNMPKSVFIQAILSLRHLPTTMHRELRKWTLSMYFDPTKDPEIRIASFLVTINTKPSTQILESMIDVVKHDPSKQMRSFVLSHLKTLVNTMDTCQTEFIRNITRVLETEDTKDFGMQYSHSYGVPITTDSKMLFNSEVIWSHEEFLPKVSTIKIATENSEKMMQVMEIVLRTDGLQDLLTKLIGPNGKFYTTKNIQSLLKEVDFNNMEVDNRFSVAMKIFGQDMGYWALNENLKSAIQQGFLGMSKNWMQFLTGNAAMPLNFRKTNYLDANVIIPTTFGLPFFATVSSSIHAQVDGEVKLIRGITDKQGIHAAVEINPLLFTQHLIYAGIDASITKSLTEYKLEAHIPQTNKWTLHIVYNKQENKQLRFFVNKPTPTQQHQQQQQFTFLQVKSTLRNILMQVKPNKVDFIIEAEPVTVKMTQKKPEIKPIIKEFTSELLPMKAKVTIVKPQVYFVSAYPIPFHLMGDFMFQLDLQPQGPQDEGMEVRVSTLVTPNQPQSKTNMKFAMNVQLLRTKFQTTTTTPDLSLFDTQTQFFNQNPKFYNRQSHEVGESLMEIRLNFEQTEKNLMKFKIFIDLMNFVNDKFMIQGELKMPRPISFQMKIDFNENRESFIELKASLMNKNQITLLKYLMTLDMDDVVLNIYREIVRNMEDFRAFHPQMDECINQMKSGDMKSFACWNIWRLLNTFNRWNHTIDVVDKTRVHTSLVASPFNLGVIGVNFILNNFQIPLPKIVMPNTWFTHAHPVKYFGNNILREMTKGGYPATCNVVGLKNNEIMFDTFDGISYKSGLSTASENVRMILLQDIKNNIQVSAFRNGEHKIIQIIGRDMKHIHITRRADDKEIHILVDGNAVTEFPFIIKNDNDNVIMRIQPLPLNSFDIENLYLVEMPLLGLNVKTDLLKLVSMNVSPFYHNQLRGFCGNFDGESVADLMTRNCQGFFWRPEDILKSKDFLVSDVKGTETDIISFLQQHHRDHNDPFIPLEVCQPGRLIPVDISISRQ